MANDQDRDYQSGQDVYIAKTGHDVRYQSGPDGYQSDPDDYIAKMGTTRVA